MSGSCWNHQDAAHQEHLVEDAQLTEELGIRYTDAEFGKRASISAMAAFWTMAVSGRTACRGCSSAIEMSHGVTPEQIRLARSQRNRSV